MNHTEFLDRIRMVPEYSGIKYSPAFMWPRSERMPLAAVSLPVPETDVYGTVIRMPRKVCNWYKREVSVISIAPNLFRGNEAVTDIVLPSGLRSIPDGAFAGCTSLERITIPRMIRYIGPGTFLGCSSLADVYYEGTPEEWDKIRIVHEKHEIEFGDLIPGSPVQQVKAERRIHIPGNDALLTANIHFHCIPDGDKTAGSDPSAASGFRITAGGRDVTNIFRAV